MKKVFQSGRSASSPFSTRKGRSLASEKYGRLFATTSAVDTAMPRRRPIERSARWVRGGLLR